MSVGTRRVVTTGAVVAALVLVTSVAAVSSQDISPADPAVSLLQQAPTPPEALVANRAPAVAPRTVRWNQAMACNERPGPPSDVLASQERQQGAELGPKDGFEYSRWLRESKETGEVNRVLSLLDGSGGDTHIDGVVGRYFDHGTQQLVVVLDPGAIPDGTWLNSLTAASGDQVAVLVKSGCRSRAELEGLRTDVQQGTWQDQDAPTPFTLQIDAVTSTVVITIDEGSQDLKEVIEKQFPEGVQVQVGTVSLRDRMSDGSPHYGGAAIGGSGDRFCTAGFTVKKNGGNWMVTAAHCSRNYSPSLWYSGTKYFGVESLNAWPTNDVMLLGSGTQKYSRQIHVDPCCPSVRLVTAANDPHLGDDVCVSGYITKAVCGVEVTDDDLYWCEDIYCWDHLMFAQKNGQAVGDDGDSGAPVYTRLSGNKAEINGMETAGTQYDNMVFWPQSTVVSVAGASVATTCCDDTSY